MAQRILSAALSLGVGLLITAGVACSTNVIEEHRAAPAVTDPDGGDLDGGSTVNPDSSAPDTSTGPAFTFKAAPDGTFAQAATAGGSVQKAPKVVPIVFTGDPAQATITSFISKLGKSTYWNAISSEYGVGPLTSKSTIVLNEAAPNNIDDQQISSWLQQKFSTNAAQFGTPDPNTLYAIFYPANTTVTQGGGAGCKTFGGYHYEANVGGTKVGYAVLPRCASFAELTGDDVITFASSHEILEWATDPFPASDPAYEFVDDLHAVWSKVFLGELGDLCTQMGNVSDNPTDLGFLVQRTWSNVQAAAGHHPCAPLVSKTPYFTAFPAKSDTINVTDMYGRHITTQGFTVGVGQTKTIDLTMYADGAITPWQVQVIDLTQLTGSSEEFSYALDKRSGSPGDTLKLTITGVASAQQGQGFLIVSQHGNDLNLWPVWVIN